MTSLRQTRRLWMRERISWHRKWRRVPLKEQWRRLNSVMRFVYRDVTAESLVYDRPLLGGSAVFVVPDRRLVCLNG